jgi:hypothetical protein
VIALLENVQIIFYKKVDLGLVFWDSCITHGNTKHNKLVKMRTQKLLITAAAALAAGVISSQAQVYSQNIVGYVNQVVAGNNALTLVENPLLGATNNAEGLLNLQGGETLLLWSGGGYYVYNYQQGAAAGGYPSDWTDGGGAKIAGGTYDSGTGLTFVPAPTVPAGLGFFVQNPNGPETNTYVGQVVLSSTNVLAGNNALSVVGSVLPIAGDLETNSSIALPLQGGENILVWTGGGYYVYNYQQGAAAGGYPSDWTDGGGAKIPGGTYDSGTGLTFVPDPSVAVGQAFFYQNPNSNESWVQNLVVQ